MVYGFCHAKKMDEGLMIMKNYFCSIFGQRKRFSLISSWVYCQRSSQQRISDTP